MADKPNKKKKPEKLGLLNKKPDAPDSKKLTRRTFGRKAVGVGLGLLAGALGTQAAKYEPPRVENLEQQRLKRLNEISQERVESSEGDCFSSGTQPPFPGLCNSEGVSPAGSCYPHGVDPELVCIAQGVNPVTGDCGWSGYRPTTGQCFATGQQPVYNECDQNGDQPPNGNCTDYGNTPDGWQCLSGNDPITK